MARHTNAQVRHIFAQGNGQSAQAGNFFCVDNRLYSYRTPVAKFHHSDIIDRDIVLITSDGYSVSTKTKQLSGLHAALMPTMYFTVPYVGEEGGLAPWGGDDFHSKNLEYLKEQYDAAKLRESRRRGEPQILSMAEAANTYDKYGHYFRLRTEHIPVDVDFLEIRNAYETRGTPEAKAKRAADKARRDAAAAVREQERLAELAKQRQEWLAGERSGSVDGPVMFRLVERAGQDVEYVQTSLGAEVPLRHAIRAFHFVKLVRARGETWQRNGHRLAVGHFEISMIHPNGDFTAGCHNVTWAEVERFARQLGVFNDAPSDEALETAE